MDATWSLSGWIVQACNCDWGCPCNFQARPTHGHCEGGWVIDVVEGSFDGTALGGLHFAVMADWPGAIHEGGGAAIVIIDERGDDRQREALRQIAAGEAGGPYGAFLNTYRIVGTYSAPFDVVIDGPRSHANVGDIVTLEMESIRNPVTGAELSPMVVLPEGMLYRESTRYSSTSFRVNDGIRYEYSGTDSAVSRFSWHVP